MKSLLKCLMFSILTACAVYSQSVMAACGDSGGGNVNNEFGTSLSLSAQDIFTLDCSEYILDPADLDEDLEKSHSASISGTSPLDNSVSSSQVSALFSVPAFGFVIDSHTEYSGAVATTFTLASGAVGDTIYFSTDLASYNAHFEFCGTFSTQFNIGIIEGTGAGLEINGHAPGSTNIEILFDAGGSDFTIPISGASSGSVAFSPSSVGTQCLTGVINVTDAIVGADVNLDIKLDGGSATTSGSNPSGTGGYSDGHFESTFKITSVTPEVSCSSASGTNSACGDAGTGGNPVPLINPHKCPFGCETSTGNPINFSLGFKHQTESDYANGVLSFKRYYRSDADWYANSVGQRWRHNYDRFVVVTGDKAVVTNEAGLVHTFEDDGSGNWKPIAEDNDLTATLESIPTGYLYTTPSDTREYYNTDGRLIRIEFRGGESLNLTYDALNRLASVSDESGRSLGFSYNGSDKPIISMSTPDGVYSYSYGLNNNLTSVTKPDTKTRKYHYEDTNFINALTGITDENGVRYATYGYDGQGRAISSEHAGGVNNHTIAYNADDSVTTTNPLGKQTTYRFETILGVRKVVKVEGHQSAHCAAANKASTYDERGFLKSKTDWIGNVTTYERDARGLVTLMTEAAGSNAQRTTTYTYDSLYRLPETITETGKVTTYQYDAEGRTVSESVADTDTGETRTTTYTYYPNTVDSFGNAVLGRLASIDGPRSDVNDITSFEYDSQFNLTKITNALGHETEMLQFDASGRPTLIEDSNGIRTRMVYDPEGRLLRVAQGTNTSIKSVTRHVYDDKGQLVKTIAPNGTFLRYAYDDAGRLIRMINSDSKILYTLDNAGNRIREVYKDSAGNVRYKHRQVFDELSRVIREIDDNGDKTRYAYDVNGNLTKIIDGNANKTRFVYDALDRQTRTVDALDGRTVQTFNELDQLTRVKDPRDNATRYVYNAFGDLIREISPDTGKTVNTVDAAGNVVRRKDARGVITRYSYDALNRLTHIVYPSDPSLNVVLVYDNGSGCGYSIGRLCEIKDASGITRYSYDALGRLIQVIETRGALSFTTSYGYDLSGNVTGITLPSGRTIAYGLDGNGQINSVNAGIGGAGTILADAITYLPFGGIEGLTYGNGITLTNTYNTAYQLTDRHIGSLLNDNYSYDAAGNITVKGTASYGYDPLYRLLNENSNAGLFDYSYDAIGNRLTEGKNGSSTSYIYPFDSSKLSAINATPVTYDAAGNIITDIQRSYTIDAAGRVQDVSISGALAGSYIYNANNQRTEKTVNGSTTHYVYGLGGQLYGEYDSTGNLIREYVYLNGEPLAQIDSGENIAYLHTDHIGTPRIATDSNADQVWGWQSDAFGNGSPTGSATVNLRFAGQYYDAESGLHYNWNRYYDPQTGRYITSDPIGLDGGLNTYAYVNANPVMFVDPRGQIKWKGTLTLSSVFYIIGGQVVLRSECIAPQGEYVYIDIWLGGLTGGISIPISGTKTNISFDDKRKSVDPDIFTGLWTIVSGGVSIPNIIPGKHTEFSYGRININGIVSSSFKVFSKTGKSPGFQGSIIDAGFGYARVMYVGIFDK